jgi:peptide/nickel transport system permease protein
MIHMVPGQPEVLPGMKDHYGFDKPLYQQYIFWTGKLLKGDLGESILKPGMSVADLLRKKVGITAQYVIAAFFVSVIVSLPLGIRMGLHPEGLLARRFLIFYTGIGVAIPPFWLGILLILFFAVFLGILPTSGFRSILKEPIQSVRYSILPALCGGIPGSVILTNFISSSIAEVKSKEYIVAAIAKGLPDRLIVFKHILKNAFIPVVTVAALTIGRMMAGAVVIERVCGIPELGRLLANAIEARDYAVIQADFLLIVCIVILVNLCADLLYAWLDPRIRLD